MTAVLAAASSSLSSSGSVGGYASVHELEIRGPSVLVPRDTDGLRTSQGFTKLGFFGLDRRCVSLLTENELSVLISHNKLVRVTALCIRRRNVIIRHLITTPTLDQPLTSQTLI